MINTFKNFERLRYRLSNDMREIWSETQKKNENLKTIISSTIFSTIFSALITEVSFNFLKTESCCSSNGAKELFSRSQIQVCLITIILFIFIYVTTFYGYRLVVKIICFFYKETNIKKTNASYIDKIQINKDFDNIACDSILVANDYKKMYFSLKKESKNNPYKFKINQNMQIFYFYEVMHYLETACQKTNKIIEQDDEIVRTGVKGIGIDLYRIANIKNLMNELYCFLNSEKNLISINNPDKESINNKLHYLKKELQIIENFLLKKYSN